MLTQKTSSLKIYASSSSLIALKEAMLTSRISSEGSLVVTHHLIKLRQESAGTLGCISMSDAEILDLYPRIALGVAVTVHP